MIRSMFVPTEGTIDREQIEDIDLAKPATKVVEDQVMAQREQINLDGFVVPTGKFDPSGSNF
jgi:hypothetical protein